MTRTVTVVIQHCWLENEACMSGCPSEQWDFPAFYIEGYEALKRSWQIQDNQKHRNKQSHWIKISTKPFDSTFTHPSCLIVYICLIIFTYTIYTFYQTSLRMPVFQLLPRSWCSTSGGLGKIASSNTRDEWCSHHRHLVWSCQSWKIWM